MEWFRCPLRHKDTPEKASVNEIVMFSAGAGRLTSRAGSCPALSAAKPSAIIGPKPLTQADNTLAFVGLVQPEPDPGPRGTSRVPEQPHTSWPVESGWAV